MPAAPLRERRVSNRSRPLVAGGRARTRAPRAVYTPTSKLKAVRTVGLTGPAAIAASILLAALIVAAALATGGRLDQAEEVAQGAADKLVDLWASGDALVERAASE